MIVLDEFGGQPKFAKLIDAESLHEKAARIAQHLRHNHDNFIQVARFYLQRH